MKEKTFAIRENFKYTDIARRNEIIREGITKIIRSRQEKEFLQTPEIENNKRG